MYSSVRRKCICNSRVCREAGGEGEMRVPLGKRAAYQNALGLADEITLQDPRVWLGHFQADDVEASKQSSGPGGVDVVVKLAEGALPRQTDEQMSTGTRGQLLSRLRRSNAIQERHRQSLLDASMTDLEKDDRIQGLEDRVNVLEKTIRELTVDGKQRRRANREEEAEEASGKRSRIDDSILEGQREEIARSLCGLSSAQSLKNLYNFLNIGGVAETMNFYNANPVQAEGVKEDGRRVARRPKTLGGTNGLFFVLFAMRTATSIRVTSTLFGVSDSTGGRAFTSWLDLLANCLRPLVRLPDVGSVVLSAPPNFRNEGLSSVAVVLDGTEIWCEKVWQTDAQHALWSQYKKRYTAKILMGIIPAGAICFVSDAFVGRTSDVELVRRSGIVEELAE